MGNFTPKTWENALHDDGHQCFYLNRQLTEAMVELNMIYHRFRNSIAEALDYSITLNDPAAVIDWGKNIPSQKTTDEFNNKFKSILAKKALSKDYFENIRQHDKWSE